MAQQLRLGVVPLTTQPLTTNTDPLPPRAPSRAEIIGRKGSIFYRAHSYHTKVPPEGIAGLIEHYTDPGDIVVDPFCGSGMTGVAALHDRAPQRSSPICRRQRPTSLAGTPPMSAPTS